VPCEVRAPEDGCFRDHDLRIRCCHRAGLVPSEIAVVLNDHGLRVRMWAAGEHFVRVRLEGMGLTPNRSRTVFCPGQGSYRLRPERRKRPI
jgi:hypothetical protein